MKSKQGWLGIDIGGTGIKAGVFDIEGKQLAFSRYSFKTDVFDDGRVELDSRFIIEGLKSSVKQVISKSRVKIAALSVSSQGETFLPVDKKGKPLHNAIIWYDGRAKKEAQEIEQVAKEHNIKLPYPILPIFTLPKILWLKKHFASRMRNVHRYLLVPDYISYLLTGQAVYDPSTAMSTGVYCEETNTYLTKLLKQLEIDESQLSKVVPSASPIALVNTNFAKELSLPSDALLVSGTNDQYAGALGAGNCEEGILSFTTGTCLALVTLLGKPPKRLLNGLFAGRFPLDAYYFLLAYAKTPGVVLDWFKGLFGGFDFDILIKEAKKSPCGASGLMVVPHFDGIVSPHPFQKMRGVIAGITLKHTRADMFRSFLEAFAFILKENIQALQRYVKPFRHIRAIGGGAKNDLFLQIAADVTGFPIEEPKIKEAATLGAAMIAAAGSGALSLREASKNFYHGERIFKPNKKSFMIYNNLFIRYKHLIANLKHYFIET